MDYKKILSSSTLKKLMSPQASSDLNRFLEALPQNAGQNVLIAAGIAWGVAAALGLITMVKVQELTALRAEYREAEALTPEVPSIAESAVPAADVEKFAKQFEKIYSGLSVRQSGSKITVSAASTSRFGQFREAIGHVYNGGRDWRVSLESLCVGRECTSEKNSRLVVSLNLKKVSVENIGQ